MAESGPVTVRGGEALGGRAPSALPGPSGEYARAHGDAVRRLEQRVAQLEAELGAGRPARPHSSAPFSARNVLTILGLVVVVAAVVALGYLAWKGISLVLIAILFALALNPAVEFFVSHGLGRGQAAGVVFVLAVCVVAALGLLLIPPLVAQITKLVNSLPELVASLRRGHGVLGGLERRFHVLETVPGAISGRGSDATRGVAGSGLDVVLGLLGTAASMVVVAFLTFFMLLEGPSWTQRVLRLVPDATRPRYERVAQGIYRTVGGFVSGNLVASLLAGVATTAALVATGISYAVPLGLLVAFLDLLPIFGMIVALIILAAVSFSHSVVAGIVVVGFVFVYHQVEVYLLRPLIYGRTVELSPLAVLVAVVIGTELAGVIGALAAIPIAGAANVVLCEVLRARADARREEILAPTT
jgi:predicted PurR-regulated permease PerM